MKTTIQKITKKNTDDFLSVEETKQLKFKCPACGKPVNLSIFSKHLEEDLEKIRAEFYKET